MPNVQPSAIVDAFFQDNFPEKTVLKMVYENNVLLSWLPKDTSQGGRRLVLPVMFGDPQSTGPTRAVVQAIQSTEGGQIRGQDWIVPWGGYKAGIEITRSDLILNRKEMRKFLDLQKEQYEGILRTFGSDLETYLWKDSGRSLGMGQTAAGVITLADRRDAINYAVGMVLQLSANDGTSSVHVLEAATLGYVIAVNGNAGTVTVSPTDGGAAGTPVGWTDGVDRYYFRYGTFGGTADPYKIITSVPQWIPATDPSATLFNGVDRTENMIALSGVRLSAADVAGKPIDVRIEELVERCDREGFYRSVGGERAFFCDGVKWLDLKHRLASMGKLEISEPTATWGFTAINLRTPKGTVPVYAADKCSPTRGWLLCKNSMKLYSAGKVPDVINEDGQTMLRNATEDKFELRCDSIHDMVIRGPGANGTCPL